MLHSMPASSLQSRKTSGQVSENKHTWRSLTRVILINTISVINCLNIGLKNGENSGTEWYSPALKTTPVSLQIWILCDLTHLIPLTSLLCYRQRQYTGSILTDSDINPRLQIGCTPKSSKEEKKIIKKSINSLMLSWWLRSRVCHR